MNWTQPKSFVNDNQSLYNIKFHGLLVSQRGVVGEVGVRGVGVQ